MPCHPDRVRRNYDTPAELELDRLFDNLLNAVADVEEDLEAEEEKTALRWRHSSQNAAEPPRFPLNREILEGERVCTVCGSGQSTHVLSERGHAFTTRNWRRLSDTAAEQLERRGVTANVIEGEHH